MKAASLVYLCLFVYPATTLLIPDPNLLRWWWRTGGGAATPPEVRERCQRNQANLLIAKFVVLIVACLLLMREALIPLGDIGFRAGHARGAILSGLGAGIVLVCWARAMRALAGRIDSDGQGLPYLLREPTSKILFVILLGGFAEEFWRALSLTVFERAGISEIFGVLITSIVFGLGHLFSYKSFGAALGRILAPTIAGIILGALFLSWQTLFIPLIAHVMLNSFAALMGRKRLIAKEASEGPRTADN